MVLLSAVSLSCQRHRQGTVERRAYDSPPPCTMTSARNWDLRQTSFCGWVDRLIQEDAIRRAVHAVHASNRNQCEHVAHASATALREEDSFARGKLRAVYD
jgi:hypothetical protein